ncbi:MAG: hypothetical protein KAI29_01030 [Cyclobacteriaceae bacterium]|nr:hypothetical protein [Cyclobacteriaceae bacterium]
MFIQDANSDSQFDFRIFPDKKSEGHLAFGYLCTDDLEAPVKDDTLTYFKENGIN